MIHEVIDNAVLNAMQCSQYAIVYILLPLLALTRPKSEIIHKIEHTSKQRNKTIFH